MDLQQAANPNNTILAPQFGADGRHHVQYQPPAAAGGAPTAQGMVVPRQLRTGAPQEFVPNPQDYSVFEPFAPQQDGTLGFGHGADAVTERNISDWSLQTIDKKLLSMARMWAHWERPSESWRKMVMEIYAIRSKYLQLHAGYSLQMQKRFAYTKSEADQQASKIIDPQMQHEIQLVQSTYPGVGAMIQMYPHAKISLN